MKCMLRYKTLPQHIEAVFVQNILKLFTYIMMRLEVNRQYDEILTLVDLVADKMNESIKSAELEVQERSSNTLMILNIVRQEIMDRKF